MMADRSERKIHVVPNPRNKKKKLRIRWFVLILISIHIIIDVVIRYFYIIPISGCETCKEPERCLKKQMYAILYLKKKNFMNT